MPRFMDETDSTLDELRQPSTVDTINVIDKHNKTMESLELECARYEFDEGKTYTLVQFVKGKPRLRIVWCEQQLVNIQRYNRNAKVQRNIH